MAARFYFTFRWRFSSVCPSAGRDGNEDGIILKSHHQQPPSVRRHPVATGDARWAATSSSAERRPAGNAGAGATSGAARGPSRCPARVGRGLLRQCDCLLLFRVIQLIKPLLSCAAIVIDVAIIVTGMKPSRTCCDGSADHKKRLFSLQGYSRMVACLLPFHPARLDVSCSGATGMMTVMFPSTGT